LTMDPKTGNLKAFSGRALFPHARESKTHGGSCNPPTTSKEREHA
jgi:hypothetical protein